MTKEELRQMRTMPKGPFGPPIFAAYFSLLFGREVDEQEARTLIADFNRVLWEEAGRPKETTFADLERSSEPLNLFGLRL